MNINYVLTPVLSPVLTPVLTPELTPKLIYYSTDSMLWFAAHYSHPLPALILDN